MEAKIYQGFMEYFIRERVLVFGRSECGKTSLIQSLMQFQFVKASHHAMTTTVNTSISSRTPTTNADQTTRPARGEPNYHHGMRRTNAFIYESSERLRMLTSTMDPITMASAIKPQVSDQYFFMSQYGNANIVMRIWDVSMEHLFIFLDPAYQYSQSLLALYDSSEIDELYHIRSPLELYLEKLSPEQRHLLTIFVVATKIDQEPVQTLPHDMNAWFHQNQIRHFYVSSTLDKGINVLRSCMLQCIYQKHRKQNLWIHRDSMIERFLSKFSCESQKLSKQFKNLENQQEDQQDGDFNSLVQYCRKFLPFKHANIQGNSAIIFQNIRIATQNICQCLDHLTMTSGTYMEEAKTSTIKNESKNIYDKKSQNFYEY